MSQLVDILYYTWYNPNVIKREHGSQQNTTRNYKIMNKPIFIVETDNVCYNVAKAVTENLNKALGRNYTELEFYGDRFKSDIKENYEDTISAAIVAARTEGIVEYRDGGLKLEETLCKHRVISTTLDMAYSTKYKIPENLLAECDEPVVYIGTNYEMCVRMPADLKILVKFDVDHKKNRIVGNEDNFYVVNTLEEVEQIVSFYAEHPEMIYFH